MKHACHNREPIADGYMHTSRQWVGDGFSGQVMDVTTWVPHRMTTDCQTRGEYPPLAEGCEGCRWREPA